MDELFTSGIKLAYPPEYSFIFENGDETELSTVQKNLANCQSFGICVDWAMYQKNVSLLLVDKVAEDN
jgi:HKD family nuclease